MTGDIISIVEAAYDLGSDDRTWLTQLLERVEPELNRGFGVTVSTFTPGIAPSESLVGAHKMSAPVQRAILDAADAYPEVFQAINKIDAVRPARCGTATQRLGIPAEQADAFPPFVSSLHQVGVRDFLGVLSLDPSGHAIWLGAPTPDTRPPTRHDCTLWGRIAAHISAGARLRRTVARLRGPDLSTGDAVLSASGAVEHAESCAQGRSARESLRRAALCIDRARGKARGNQDAALDLWRGLVAGRWSLVEQFDHDGRRYLVAHRNDPEVEDPRGLTLRERQVLAYMAAGDSLKLTAYTLGLSISSVFRHRETAMRKLGLTCHAEVARLFSTAPPSSDSRD
jgi:DNA-binding CsgD family transcriptional regulator